MQIHTAKTIEDVRNVKEFTEDPTWKHARSFLEAAPGDPFADHLRWLETAGKVIACVQVFLHHYPLGSAKVGMCLPEYPFVPPESRGKGHFKRLMADLFQWLRQNGYPLAYSHGRKGLYTHSGYAACFHHCMVLVRAADAVAVRSPGRAEPATDADVTAHKDLFRRPFPLGRGLQCRDELWRPDPACVRLVPANRQRGILGFVVLGQVIIGRHDDGERFADFVPPEGDHVLTVTDSWAADVPTAARLLRTVAEEARDAGFEWIRLNCRRDDVLARVAVLAGGQLRWSAAQERDHTPDGEDVDAFYLTDLPLAIEQLLSELNVRWSKFSGDAPSCVRLRMDDQELSLRLGRTIALGGRSEVAAPAVRLPRKAMTRAVMGYASPTELAVLHTDCHVPGECREAVDALFPAREPHLIHEELAFAKPERFGLVP